jgi:hypothetical protein
MYYSNNESDYQIKLFLFDWHVELVEEDLEDLKYRLILVESNNQVQFRMFSHHSELNKDKPKNVIAEFMFEDSSFSSIVANNAGWIINYISRLEFYSWFQIVGRFITAYNETYPGKVAFRMHLSLSEINKIEKRHLVKNLEKKIEVINSGELLEKKVKQLLMLSR